jgi:hypothetical protein
MVEARRKKTRSGKHDAISKGYDEKERPCLFMPYLQILLNSGQQRGQDDSGKKVQEENSYEKEEGCHLRAEG